MLILLHGCIYFSGDKHLRESDGGHVPASARRPGLLKEGDGLKRSMFGRISYYGGLDEDTLLAWLMTSLRPISDPSFFEIGLPSLKPPR